MSDDNKNNDKPELPDVFTLPSHCYEAARRGFTLKTIAARSGRTVEEFKRILAANPDVQIKLQLAFGEFEQKEREEIEAARLEAIAQGHAALRYKIAREALKEQIDRDATVKVCEVNLSDDESSGGVALSVVIAKANRDPATGQTLGEPTVTPLNSEKGRDE